MDFDEANKIVSDTELEGLLISKGISKDHIANIKTEKLNQEVGFYKYYESVDSEEVEILVQTNKINGIHRASSQHSIFNNAAGKCYSELNVLKMATAITEIQEKSLSQLYDWYERGCYPVRLVHYLDDDIYAVSGDGNHRCLYARVIGAPVIRAEVSKQRINHEKKENYQYSQRLKEEYSISQFGNMTGSYNFIEFKFRDNKYIVCGYEYRISSNSQPEAVNLTTIEKELQSDFKLLNKWYLKINKKVSGAVFLFLKYICKYDRKSLYRVKDHYNRRMKIADNTEISSNTVVDQK